MSRIPKPSGSVPDGASPATRERFLRYKKALHQQLIASMDLSRIGTLSEDELRIEVRRAAEGLCLQSPEMLSLSEREQLVSEVLDETFGLGPLEPLMRDPHVSDILINGPKTVYVEREGRLHRASINFNDERHLLQIIQRIAGRVGRTAAASTPSSRRWPWTARWFPSAASAPTRSSSPT
jgi:pilus assembly protein CpaF